MAEVEISDNSKHDEPWFRYDLQVFLKGLSDKVCPPPMRSHRENSMTIRDLYRRIDLCLVEAALNEGTIKLPTRKDQGR